ncbi:hypothetical protein AWB77_06828 [Caballeronia fortuita]|uniref:Uncharacterized protein n=1 Tax=Caballeronia fortuita TaxID=1777138 RepID=A0A158EA50_9BURK|nr:hypothetical protein AWB77_06828 [Caballeronia fortuita]
MSTELHRRAGFTCCPAMGPGGLRPCVDPAKEIFATEAWRHFGLDTASDDKSDAFWLPSQPEGIGHCGRFRSAPRRALQYKERPFVGQQITA